MKTLKEISEELNLTKERVRQIRENGIKFLQNWSKLFRIANITKLYITFTNT